MKLDKEMLALKKDFVTRGTFITADCAIRTEYEPPRSDDLDQIRKRLDALKQAVRKC